MIEYFHFRKRDFLETRAQDTQPVIFFHFSPTHFFCFHPVHLITSLHLLIVSPPLFLLLAFPNPFVALITSRDQGQQGAALNVCHPPF